MALGLRRGRTVDRASPEPPPIAAPDRPPRRTSRVFATVGALFFAAVSGGAVGALGFDQATRDHLLPGTRIGGVLVGGRSVAEAETQLAGVFVTPLHEPITVRALDGSTEVTPWALGMRVDVRDVVFATHQRQQQLSLARRSWLRVRGVRSDVPLGPYVEAGLLRRELRSLARRLDRPVRDASVVLEDGKLQVIPHRIGRRVDLRRAPERLTAALRNGERRVDLPVDLTQPERRTEDFEHTIVVKTISNTLDLYVHGRVSKHYGVATGTGGYPTPKGLFVIEDKQKWPGWSNPHQPWSIDMPEYIPPGRGNPLGTRALYLDVSGIRIHGTPEEWSIGSNASHGCVRMHIRDSEELYPLVPVGTPVLIVAE